MALKPMNDTIFGELVGDGAFDDLTKLFYEVSAKYQEEISDNFAGQLQRDERIITAQLQKENKLHYMVTVSAIGPDCKELEIGDTAILPPHGGTMLTIIDEKTNEPGRVFAISESVVLARWRDE